MVGSNDFDALFNFDATSILKEDKKKFTSEDLYKPTAKDGKDNVYKSVIRFLPYVVDPDKSIINKWQVWLENPDNQQKKFVDCPSTIKAKSILQDTYFALAKSQSAQDQELAKNFSRRETFYSLVQIIKDPNHPELEGKIKIFQYGRKVYDKIKNIANPGDDMTEKNDPFNLFTGKPFMLHIKIVSSFNNYDDSQFLSKEAPIEIGGKVMTKNKENFPLIKAYLEDNSPDLSKYYYQPWDEDTKNFVLDCIDAIIPSGKIKEKLFNLNNGEKVSYAAPKATTQPRKANPTIKVEREDLEEDDIDLDIERDELDDILEEKTVAKKTTAKVAPKAKAPIEEEEDIYADL